jgi:hypothetical protein
VRVLGAEDHQPRLALVGQVAAGDAGVHPREVGARFRLVAQAAGDLVVDGVLAYRPARSSASRVTVGRVLYQ